MARKEMKLNQKANESLSKYKLLSAYGGPGSIMHTQYGSIIISCIDEWGFIKKVNQIHKDATESKAGSQSEEDYVKKQAKLSNNGSIEISNDTRLLEALMDRKGLLELKYLANVPNINLKSQSNKIDGEIDLAIPSTYMPKVFKKKNQYKSYNEWYDIWKKDMGDEDNYCDNFHPPKYVVDKKDKWYKNLAQDNIVLICEHGHISDFPWSKFLRWRVDFPKEIFNEDAIDIFRKESCCGKPDISIKSNTGNASGFDGKWIKCSSCGRGKSLGGIMGVKIKCPGHKPWEANTGLKEFYSGSPKARTSNTLYETCGLTKKNKDNKDVAKPMTVALTTGNNIYYSNTIQSIYLHDELFEDDITLRKNELETILEKEFAKGRKRKKDLIDQIEQELEDLEKNSGDDEKDNNKLSNTEKEVKYRFEEFTAFQKEVELINKNEKDLKVSDVSNNLNENLTKYFNKILRVNQMKITTAQLDFSRVIPADSDAENSNPKKIFSCKPEEVITYPVVESFGEGIFFSFNEEEIESFFNDNPARKDFIVNKLAELDNTKNQFSQNAINKGNAMNWPLYLVHSFSHLIMRELEFRAGYPTASLSERLYVSSEANYKMYGCLIYTAEGSEGSMGGLIAQTREKNLNQLLNNAINRATICNSDPLCWTSEGQGLFDLNLASCFSCSLVSETSCEHSNLYLDRQILVDSENGFFKEIIN
jgi:hypothetical protein